MIFRANGKEYRAATAIEIVSALALDAADFTAQTANVWHEFLNWSLNELSDRLPARELGFARARVSDEVLARNYLSLRHDYNLGELLPD